MVEAIARYRHHQAFGFKQAEGTDQRPHSGDANFCFSLYTISPDKTPLPSGRAPRLCQTAATACWIGHPSSQECPFADDGRGGVQGVLFTDAKRHRLAGRDGIGSPWLPA
jgi:hypothetical protein